MSNSISNSSVSDIFLCFNSRSDSLISCFNLSLDSLIDCFITCSYFTVDRFIDRLLSCSSFITDISIQITDILSNLIQTTSYLLFKLSHSCSSILYFFCNRSTCSSIFYIISIQIRKFSHILTFYSNSRLIVKRSVSVFRVVLTVSSPATLIEVSRALILLFKFVFIYCTASAITAS